MTPLVQALLFLDLALGLAMTLYVLARRREPAVMLAWILSFLLVPYVAALLYLFFGYHRYRRGHRPKPHPVALGAGRRRSSPILPVPADLQSEVRNVARLSERLTGFGTTPDNAVEFFIDPAKSLEAMAASIEQAKNHIHVEVYILADDAVGRRFQTLLSDAAARGVDCRLLIDPVGSLHLSRRFIRELRIAGVKTAFFSHLRMFPRLWRLHLRNHRKLMIIDGRIGYIGSQNLVDTTKGRKPEMRMWEEGQARLEGPAVGQLQSIFLEDWRFATGEVLDKSAVYPTLGSSGNEIIQALPTGPDLPEQTLSFIFLALLHTAQRRITIITPYLIPSGAIGLALEGAARRGVEVTILLPSKSDNILAKWAGHSWYAALLNAGIRIFEHPTSDVHSKVTLVDDHLTLLGSANMDARSFQLNFEAGIFVYGSMAARELRRAAEAAIEASREIGQGSRHVQAWLPRILEGACRILSPLL